MSGPGGCFFEVIAQMLLLYFLIVKFQPCLCQLKMNCFARVITREKNKNLMDIESVKQWMSEDVEV